MFRQLFFASSICLCVLSSSGAYANEDLDVTMRMVTDDDTLTDSVVREIELARPINLEAGPVTAREIAQETREEGRALGEAVAERAREQAAAERAKEAARLRQEGKPQGAPEAPVPDGAPVNPGPPSGVPGSAR